MKLSQSVLSILKPGKHMDSKLGQTVSDFYGQLVSRRYCLTATGLFTIQGVVALLGALDLVIPDLPSPIPFEFGRSVHLGLADLWPLIGTMGMVYFFTPEELGADIYSHRLARWQFWLVVFFSFSVFGSLALRIGNGREFLEGLPILYVGICLSLAFASYNLVRTLGANKQKITPAAAIMTAGTILLLIFLLPNTFTYRNPVADEAVKFWVVHLWEEMAFELTSAGFIASFLKTTGIAEQRQTEKWLYLEATLAVAAGLYGTGHHYYWIGFPAFWLVLGSVISFFQLIPVFMLVNMVYKGLKRRPEMDLREKLTLGLILSSLFYHVTGASLLGFLITIPWINLYMHGTYMTSGHAHLALFGTLGFLVLGGCYFCLSQGSEPTQKGYRAGMLAIGLLNTGLVLMSTALLLAGLIQTYLWRVVGMDFMEVQPILNPYLIIRALGGCLFTVGGLLLGWRIFKAWQETKPAKARSKV